MLFFAMLYTSAAYSQGWIGNHTTLYGVNDSLHLMPLNVGIGTSSPSAQLHTTGSVKFAGLTNADLFNRVLVQDSTGRLFWRNASTIGAGNGWLLTGNAGTNPATNFLGTTDAARLVFRTSNTERATILANGFVGIGTSNPRVKFHVKGDTTSGSMGYPYESEVVESSIDHKFGIYNTTRSGNITTAGGAALAFGYTNFKNSAGFFPGYEIQYGPFSDSLFFLRFNALDRNTAGIVAAAYQNILLLDSKGRAGINLSTGNPVAPSANLHVNGTVRFQNLPVGTGCPVVIDASGNIFSTSCSTDSGGTGGIVGPSAINLQNRIVALESQINELKTLITAMTGTLNNATNKFYSVFPNPANAELSIEPGDNKTAAGYKNVVVRDLSGKTVLTGISFQQSVRIPLGNLINGTYLVSIYNKEGKLLQTDKIVVQK